MGHKRDAIALFSRPLAALILSAGMAAAVAEEGDPVRVAMATIEGCSDKNIIGTALLQETPTSEGIKEVEVYMLVRGLSDGDHAVHVHETAECEPCTAAGGHHDPGPHGKSTPDAPDYNHPYHMGDLINIQVENGVGMMQTATNRFTLSPGRLSLFDDDGSAFIIHTEADSYCDHEDELNPGCAGGARDACGIIKPAR